MTLEGRIIIDLGEVSGTSKMGNPWKKKEFVVETLDMYPKKAKFSLFGENRIMSNPYKGGDMVHVEFDVESREFNGRWYTDLNALSVRPIDGQIPVPEGNISQSGPGFGSNPPAPQNAPQPASQPGFTADENSTDDLPF